LSQGSGGLLGTFDLMAGADESGHEKRRRRDSQHGE
jgi:hypothetical protein